MLCSILVEDTSKELNGVKVVGNSKVLNIVLGVADVENKGDAAVVRDGVVETKSVVVVMVVDLSYAVVE